MKKWILSLLLPIFLIFSSSRVYAETRPENGIYDPQHYLTQETKDKLVNFNTNHEAQLGIYIVDTLNGKNLENFARETAREWQIGYADSNKGALIMIAVKDRKFRIETSNNMATDLTDSESRTILENVKPLMRKANYDAAISAIIDSIAKEMTTTDHEQSQETDPSKSFLSYFTTEKFKNYMTGMGILITLMVILLWSMSAALELVRQDPTLNPFIRNHTNAERSQYEYNGYDKLYPNDPDFVQNATWTAALVAAFYATQAEHNRRRKSTIDDDYHDDAFASTSNKSRTSNKSNNYWSSSDSSSSWSSSDWGGSGFDGGGSSSSW